MKRMMLVPGMIAVLASCSREPVEQPAPVKLPGESPQNILAERDTTPAGLTGPIHSDPVTSSSTAPDVVPTGLASSPEEDLPQGGAWALADIHEMALVGSPQLAAARERVSAAQARLQQAWSAYLPNIGLNVSSERSHSRLRKAVDDPNNDVTFKNDFGRLNLGATWLIFDGLQREFQIIAGKHDRAASEGERNEVQRQLLRGITATYCNILDAQRVQEISERDLVLNQDILRTMRARHESGLVSLADVNNFEIRANNAQLAIIGAKREVQLAQSLLGELVGDPSRFVGEDHRFEVLPHPLFVPELNHLQDLALLELPILQQLKSQYEAIEARRSAIWGQFSPRFLATADGEASGSDLTIDGVRTESFSYGLSMEWDLLSSANRPAQLSAAAAQLRELKETMETQKLQSFTTIEQDWRRLLQARAQEELLLTNVRLSQSIYQSTLESYELGQASITRVNQVLSDWLQSQRLATLNAIDVGRQFHLLHADTGFSPRFLDLMARVDPLQAPQEEPDS